MTVAASTVHDLMAGFAGRTGLTGDGAPTRYLWTDAFALCNYLGLYTSTGGAHYRDLAQRLIEQVHRVLGRHRPDDPRTGWLSGLGDEAAPQHPTAGGLRIGKSLPERDPDERYEPELEWDRDGQYSTTSPSGCTPWTAPPMSSTTRPTTAGPWRWPRASTARSPIAQPLAGRCACTGR